MMYREAIQKLQLQIETIFDKAGSLRDVADLKEKSYWNTVRMDLSNASYELSKLDDQLTDVRAAMQLRSNV